MAKVEVPCTHCGKQVFRYVSAKTPAPTKAFCDAICHEAFYSRPKTCLGCGQTFPRDVHQPDKDYCTWGCFKQSRHVTLTCVVCGKPFDSYLCEVQKRTTRGHVPCCSRACRNSRTSTLLGGDGKWVEGGKYKESRDRGHTWRLVRAAYIRANGMTCEACGAPGEVVHHLYPVAAGGDLCAFDNLMVVCRPCHEGMHAQLRDGSFACCFEGVRYAKAVSGEVV